MPCSPLVRLILFLAAVALPAGCYYLTKTWITPGVTLVDIRPAQMTAEQQTFIVSLKGNNPNDHTLPINRASYNLKVEGHEIASGAGTVDKQIPTFDEGIVEVEVNTSLMDLIRDVPTLTFTGGKWIW